MPHTNIPNNMLIIIKFITLIPCNCNGCSHTVTECVHSHEAWFISISMGGMLRHSPFVISFRDSRHKVWISIEIRKIIIITCMFTYEIMKNHGSNNNLFCVSIEKRGILYRICHFIFNTPNERSIT